MSDSESPAPDPTLFTSLCGSDRGLGDDIDPTPSLLEPSPFNDTGALLNPAMSIESVSETISNLPNDEMYNYLYRHIEPPRILPIHHSCLQKQTSLISLGLTIIDCYYTALS